MQKHKKKLQQRERDFYGKINSQRHTNKHSINLQINVPEQKKWKESRMKAKENTHKSLSVICYDTFMLLML